jgi:orotate phosphoribosyltransferase
LLNKFELDVLKYAFKRSGAIQIAPSGKEFTLASGAKSSYYLDCRKAILSADSVYPIATMLFKSIDKLHRTRSTPICVGATSVGGAPLVGAVLAIAAKYFVPWRGFVVHDEKKECGFRKTIEGHFDKLAMVVLVEDMITSGGSIIRAIETIGAEGGAVHSVHAIVDCETGGITNIAKLNVPTFALVTVKELVNLEELDAQNTTQPELQRGCSPAGAVE